MRWIATRVLSVCLACAVGFLGTALPVAGPASAQEASPRWSLRKLFSPRQQERRIERPRRARTAAPVKRRIRKAAAVAQRRVAPREEPAAPVAEKAQDAETVLVVGDFLAGGLAEGLEAAFADTPAVRILDRSNGSSGLVRDDYYNWPVKLAELVQTEKPAAVAIMLGSNDRQALPTAEGNKPPLTEAWIKAYGERAEALADVLVDSQIPFVWIGMPAFKSSKMTSDMLAFNEIYRAAAEKAGGEFVDIWEGFVDEKGVFVSIGPDVNGQPVRLRGDGINMTRSGSRKIAFYAEKPLIKILGSPLDGTAPDVSLVAPADLRGTQPALQIDRTVPISLDDPEFDGGAELLGGDLGKVDASDGQVQAIPAPPPASSPVVAIGRADDFRWPSQAAPKTQAPASVSPAPPIPVVQSPVSPAPAPIQR